MLYTACPAGLGHNKIRGGLMAYTDMLWICFPCCGACFTCTCDSYRGRLQVEMMQGHGHLERGLAGGGRVKQRNT